MVIFVLWINGRGYEKVDCIHYFGSSINYSVASDVSIIITTVLGLMTGWDSQIVDVKGAFINGELDDSDKMYMSVTQGLKSTTQ